MDSKMFTEMKTASASLEDARAMAKHITEDLTVGGIFKNGDLTKVDEARFSTKWCKWWPVPAKPILEAAKLFTGPKVDAVIDRLIELGDKVCSIK